MARAARRRALTAADGSDIVTLAVPSDPELLVAWRDGDSIAGQELFARYYGMVSRFFANKVCGDPADLIQATFEACLRSHEQIRDGGQFRSFLFGIAYNVLRGHYRSKRAHDDRFDPTTRSSADLSPGAGSMLACGEEQQLLLAALRRLPLEHQIALELFYWEDLTIPELAAVLEIPEGTVKSRLHRGRALLEQAMDRIGAPDDARESVRVQLGQWAARMQAAAHDDGGSPGAST